LAFSPATVVGMEAVEKGLAPNGLLDHPEIMHCRLFW